MPSVTKRSGCSSGSSTTSRSFSRLSPAPPTSSYVTSGFSSTVIIVTEGSMRGGSGIWIEYLLRSTPAGGKRGWIATEACACNSANCCVVRLPRRIDSILAH
jgi:hypothetical protein